MPGLMLVLQQGALEDVINTMMSHSRREIQSPGVGRTEGGAQTTVSRCCEEPGGVTQ
jgi:hypothetical protein